MALVIPLGGGGYEDDLRKLRIPAQCVEEALGASNQERRACSPYGAPTARGYYAYNGMVASMTKQLRDHGWRRINVRGVLPLLVNRDLTEVLGIMSGDPMTGRFVRGREPRSRYPKGELTKRLVSRNQPPNQTALFDRPNPTKPEPDDPLARYVDYQFWLTLVYFDKDAMEIRCEVSLPETQNASGYVSHWYHRIAVPPYKVDDMPGDDPNEGFGPIDVPVEPR